MSRLFRNKFEDYMNDPDELTPEELKEWDKFVMDCAIIGGSGQYTGDIYDPKITRADILQEEE